MRKAGTGAKMGRGCGTFFFAFFLLLGSFFTVMVAREIYRTVLTYGWAETDCEILASGGQVDRGAASDEPPYVFTVSYRYEWQGQTHLSSTFGLDRPAYDDWARVRRLEKRFPAGTRAGCYVNPEAPAESILSLRSFWMALVLPFPLLFVVIGGGGIYAMWFQRERVRRGIESIPAKAPRRKAWLAPMVFAIVFLAGSGTFFGFLARPAWQFANASRWEPTPCTVEFSRVGVHRGDDGTTYSVDVLFRYEVDGEEYRSSRFRFLGGSSSGYAAKRDTVRQYPRGTEATCYVSPDDREEAVLDKSFPPTMLFGLIPLIMMLVGGGGLHHQWKRRSEAPPGARQKRPVEVAGPSKLEPKVGRWGKLAGSVVFACIWNGIVSVFLWQVIESWQRGRPEMFLTVFLVPFVLVGLGSICLVAYFLLGLFSPRVRLDLSRTSVRPGESTELSWLLSGRVSAVERLRITLQGREETTYRKGDNNRFEKQDVVEVELADRRAPLGTTPNFASVRIPPDAMHTHEGKGNKFLWYVHVRGVVRGAPDIDLEYPIRVLPATVVAGDYAEPEPELAASGPLRISLRRGRYRPGETVEGRVQWQLPAAPKYLELRLFWYTSGIGAEEVSVVASERFDSTGASGERPFRLKLPESPRSYAGKSFSIHWALELVVQSGEETARTEFEVG